jgi:LPS sulfotransferase NodH
VREQETVDSLLEEGLPMLLIRDLYRKEYDRPVKVSRPAKSIMIATIPRSGSTFFGICMWHEGVFGLPLEYLNPNTSAFIRKRLGRNLDEYWRNVQSVRCTPNLVFCYKMFIANYIHYQRKHTAFLERIAPDHVIYLTRGDKVGQAISYARAIQTRRWFAAVEEQNPAEYSYARIRAQEKAIRDQERFWERIFDVTGTVPLRVEYEQLLSDRAAVMHRIADFAGVKLDPAQRLEIGNIEKQSDRTNDDWRERYLEDRAKRVSAASPA